MCQVASVVSDPMGWSTPGSSVHGILQAKIQEWIAISYSRESQLGIEPASLISPAFLGRFFTSGTTWEAFIGEIEE